MIRNNVNWKRIEIIIWIYNEKWDVNEILKQKYPSTTIRPSNRTSSNGSSNGYTSAKQVV